MSPDSNQPGFHSDSSDCLNTEAIEEILFSLKSTGDHAEVVTGQVLGKYRVRQLLGCHGQATVVLAADTQLERPVVLKIYHASASGANRNRIMNEGRALARISSPHVATCFGVEEIEEFLFLVIEYIEGTSLREQLQTSQLTEQQIVQITQQLTLGVKAVHEVGLIHRDLKPANAMVTPQGTVKLIDFGLVNSLSGSHAMDSSGTPAYMAPECSTGQIDERTDIFGIGAILYEMLTGKPPFDAASKSASRELSRNGDYAPVESLNPRASRFLKGVCQKCLKVNPEDRYDDVESLLAAISGRNSTRRWFLAGILIVAVTVFVAYQRLSTNVPQTSETGKGKLADSFEVWTLRNREHPTRYLRESDHQLLLAPFLEESARWQIEPCEDGISLRNVATGNYLASSDWDAFTTSRSRESLPPSAFCWDRVKNEDGSIALKNQWTGRYLDGDGRGKEWNVDVSEELLNDDGWFVDSIPSKGPAIPSSDSSK